MKERIKQIAVLEADKKVYTFSFAFFCVVLSDFLPFVFLLCNVVMLKVLNCGLLCHAKG